MLQGGRRTGSGVDACASGCRCWRSLIGKGTFNLLALSQHHQGTHGLDSEDDSEPEDDGEGE